MKGRRYHLVTPKCRIFIRFILLVILESLFRCLWGSSRSVSRILRCLLGYSERRFQLLLYGLKSRDSTGTIVVHLDLWWFCGSKISSRYSNASDFYKIYLVSDPRDFISLSLGWFALGFGILGLLLRYSERWFQLLLYGLKIRDSKVTIVVDVNLRFWRSKVSSHYSQASDFSTIYPFNNSLASISLSLG